MKQLLIYDQPVALNRARHRHPRLKSQQAHFKFARYLNSVPLTTAEFADAARDYPIVFASLPDQASMPAVLLGLTALENLFVRDDGRWEAEAYIPAFLRRYPFVEADKRQSGNYSVCLDRPFLLDEGREGEHPFGEDGHDALALSRALKFLADYQGAIERTKAMMQQLRDNDLLVAKSVYAERPGSLRQSISGFSVVDEARLQKLSAKALKELSRTGTLGLLYVHLASLINLKRLAWRRDARALASPPPDMQ